MQNIVWLFSAAADFLVWLAQKKIEMRMKIFDDAVAALLRYQAEGCNQELQLKHYERTDKTRKKSSPYLTDETSVLMLRSITLVGEFFSQDMGVSFAKALNSIHLNGPNPDIGGPEIDGCLSIPEIEKLIQDLAKELTIPSILRNWLHRLTVRKPSYNV
jgi:hypothetical protein